MASRIETDQLGQSRQRPLDVAGLGEAVAEVVQRILVRRIQLERLLEQADRPLRIAVDLHRVHRGALAPGGRAPVALLAGLLLLLATLLSFSALPLGLLLLLYGLFGIRSRGWAPVRQLGWIGLGYGLSALLLRLATGFDFPRCFEVARDLNVRVMTAIIGGSPGELYGKIAFGNSTAFLIGAGLALVPAALLRLATAVPSLPPLSREGTFLPICLSGHCHCGRLHEIGCQKGR